jgi:thiamine biosynthesis lipoprotein
MTRRRFIKAALCSGALSAAQAQSAFAAPATRPATTDGRVLVRDAALAFGTTVSLSALHTDAARARQAVQAALAEVQLVDRLMSLYRSDSEVAQINQRGVLREAHRHTRTVLAFARQLSERTSGAFDITVQPLWEVHAAAMQHQALPDADALRNARARVGWASLALAQVPHVRLLRKGMSITLNGVAQGYAADLAMQALRAHGVSDALIDTGEWGAQGVNQQDHPWTVGVAHPRQSDALIASIPMDGRFVSTSGDYATAFTSDFVRHHIFNPLSGVSPTQWASVVVAAPTGLEADGLSTALMVLDETRGRALLAQTPGADALWIDKQMRMLQTAGMRAAVA